MSRRYDEFRNILRELFQLDQADLDFGIYRIMAVKRVEIERFLDQDLLPQVRKALEKYQPAAKADLEQSLVTMVADLRSAGVDPEDAPKVKEFREQVAKATDLDALEDEIFSHLVTFFRRYYKEGDFISQRRYKEDAYAIPYNGEEVKLYWANQDQYYVKSADYLTSFAFHTGDGPNGQGTGPRVRFALVAAETERDNNKAQPDKERRFLLHEAAPVAVEHPLLTSPGSGEEQAPSPNWGGPGRGEELVIRFVYAPDPENRKQDKINEATETAVLKAAPATWQARLAAKAPTEANPQRTLLAKHLDAFTKRNTFDFFIHKDLGKFLRRELDFFIKNEIVYLDDLVDVNDAVIKQQLSKAIVFREIAHKLIDFLAQTENFQKKLWLKKKFVVETHYCITLDRVPHELYPEIAANDRQREEWVLLFAIDAMAGYSSPVTEDFLIADPNLFVDTRFFGGDFTERLLEIFENIDRECNSLLVHSDNFQALQLLQTCFCKRIECIYIDPPYNTGDSEILYKNSYLRSSWLTLLENRISSSENLLMDDSILFIAIDDFELVNLSNLIDTSYPDLRREVIIVNHHPQGGKAKTLAHTHEYMLACVPLSSDRTLVGRSSTDGVEQRPFKRSGTAESNFRYGRPNSFYAILIEPSERKIVGLEPPPSGETYATEPTHEGYLRVYPLGARGEERVWRRSYESCMSLVSNDQLMCTDNMTIYQLISAEDRTAALFSNWVDRRYNAGTFGANLLRDIIGAHNPFSYPKSIYTVEDAIFSTGVEEDSWVLDFFAGSGTTGHAVVNLNREDGGSRKYILVEMGEYFDTVLKPRILKVVYAPDWRDGKPTSRDQGISQIIKVLRLESYEDTLDNLEFTRPVAQQTLLDEANRDDPFREAYLLHYMLELESRASPSLLNIQAFANPFDYRLKVTRNHEQQTVVVDLVETFNYLIGLRVQTLSARQHLTAEFARDAHNKLSVTRTRTCAAGEGWSFRQVEGQTPQGQKALILWRTLSGDAEKDNALLDHYFERMAYSTRDREFDVIYVNGDNNLENLRRDDETWKVRVIEADFHRLMFDVQDV